VQPSEPTGGGKSSTWTSILSLRRSFYFLGSATECIDFYAVHNGEILVMVDLFSRETMLEFLPSRKMEKVCQTIMKRIIFSRGVPDELRSD
jgi:hypothetical protein